APGGGDRGQDAAAGARRADGVEAARARFAAVDGADAGGHPGRHAGGREGGGGRRRAGCRGHPGGTVLSIPGGAAGESWGGGGGRAGGGRSAGASVIGVSGAGDGWLERTMFGSAD